MQGWRMLMQDNDEQFACVWLITYKQSEHRCGYIYIYLYFISVHTHVHITCEVNVVERDTHNVYCINSACTHVRIQ